MTARPTFCFVIPCFNEEDNVEPTVGSIREAMGGRGDYEIVLVNDASTDRTLERMQALAAADPRIRVLDNPINLGFGGSYKRGASVATATYVMMLPGDDGFPGQSIAEIISHAGEADIIIPVVTNPGARSWFRAFASKGFTTLLNWTFWLNVGYYNGAVLQRNDLLRSIEIKTEQLCLSGGGAGQADRAGCDVQTLFRANSGTCGGTFFRADAEESNRSVEDNSAPHCRRWAVLSASARTDAIAHAEITVAGISLTGPRESVPSTPLGELAAWVRLAKRALPVASQADRIGNQRVFAPGSFAWRRTSDGARRRGMPRLCLSRSGRALDRVRLRRLAALKVVEVQFDLWPTQAFTPAAD